MQLLGIFAGILAYIGVVVYIITSSAKRNQISSVLLRIMTNYFQVALLVKNLDIMWPTRVEKLIEYFSIV